MSFHAINRRHFLRTFAALTSLTTASHLGQQREEPEQRKDRVLIEPSQELGTRREKVSLNGQWDFSFDPRKVGEKEGWFAGSVRLPETVAVPGCDQMDHHPSSGLTLEDYEAFHRKNAELKTMDFGTMTELKYPVSASAWRLKKFHAPAGWRDREIWLHLGGVMPAADLWFNGKKLGTTQTSRNPVRCNLSRLVRFGSENTLAIRTFWPEGPRLDGTFDWIGFTGLYRGVWVEAAPQVHIKALYVVGRIDPPQATVHFSLAGLTGVKRPIQASCEIQVFQGRRKYTGGTELDPHQSEGHEFSIPIEMPGAALWSPQSPNLYLVAVTLRDGAKVIDSASVRFGLREIRTEGLRVLLNGRPVFLRGGCDVSIHPETIAPPTSKDFYVRRLKQAKKFGFNYTKHCMDIYTQEFLDAADELGLMVCQEMPFGVNGEIRTTVRRNLTDEHADLFRRELDNIIRSDRNHPSIVIYSMISEFPEIPLKDLKEKGFNLFCRELPNRSKQLNPNALVIDITGTRHDWSGHFPQGPRRTDLIEEHVGDEGEQDPLSHPIKGDYHQLNRPFILHEYNLWPSLPEVSLKRRYETLPYRPNGIPELEAAAARAGLSDQLPVLVNSSRRLKYLLQKCGLELARRNPKISGYHLFLISGYPWCEEGVFNEFYEEPEDLSAEEFRMYNQDTVLLLDDGNRRCFECGSDAPLGLEVSHFGPERLAEPRLEWQLLAGRTTLDLGKVRLDSVQCGTLSRSYPLGVRMPPGPEPRQLDLQVLLRNGGREVCRNHWTLWAVPAPQGGDWLEGIVTDLSFLNKAYPKMKSLGKSSLANQPVIATGGMSTRLLEYLDQGGRILLLSDGVFKSYRHGVEYRSGEKVVLPYGPNYDYVRLYRSQWGNAGPHANMGTVVADHPALGKLPHQGWCDANFVHLIHGTYPLLLEDFHPQRVDPIIRSIGHHTTMVNKAYLFEVGVGKGRLLATSLRFAGTYDSHPESRYLLECLLSYVASDAFAPKVTVNKEELILSLMKPPS